jgi:misacylated tRNA(Ala) deacylase
MTDRLYERDSYLKEAEARVTSSAAEGVVLDQTVFYAQGGGQPGDCGVLVLADGTEVRVVDTLRTASGDNLHVLEDSAAAAMIEPGERVVARIDWDRRYRHMRMHTCLHLLCAIVDAPVTGGNLNAEKGRLDFDLPEPVDRDALTAALNDLVLADTATGIEWISDAELKAQPELVRTMSVAPPTGAGSVRLLRIPGVDLQPCGGTHVARTSEIGRVRVAKIEKKSRLNRRINVVFDG